MMNINLKINKDDFKRRLGITNGIDGGDGVDGQNGIDGKDGVNGKDGSELTVDEIAKKINSKEEIINASSIKGLIKMIENLISGARMGGGVISSAPPVSNTVLAYSGDGTLLTKTDGSGTKTFAYSSGSLSSITGTGIYNTKRFTYNGSGKLTNITIG